MKYIKLFELFGKDNLPEDDKILDIIKSILDKYPVEYDEINYTNDEIEFGVYSTHMDGNIRVEERNKIIEEVKNVPNVTWVNFDDFKLSISYEN